MAVCLDYQSVYCDKQAVTSSTRFHLIAACILLLALAFKVWMKVETTQLGYQLGKERERIVQYDMEKRDLELQLSIVLRPDNLRALAEKRLGLKPLQIDQSLRVLVEG